MVLIYPTIFGDQRGFLMETYRDANFAEAGISDRFIQTNLSRSHRGVVRRLHYQKAPKPRRSLFTSSKARYTMSLSTFAKTHRPSARHGDCSLGRKGPPPSYTGRVRARFLRRE